MKDCARTKYLGGVLKLRTNGKRTNENRTNQGLGVDSRAISVSVKSAAIVETNDRFEVVQIVEKY